ncbi:aquaporin [soil metagenome]
MKKYFAEFLGTFALIFCGTGAIIINQETHGAISHVGIALTFGLIVAAMIYAFGSISGAHFNPAVTVGFWLAKKFPSKEIPFYILSQVAGGFAASSILKFLFPANEFLGSTFPLNSDFQSWVLEIILMFFLMLVILQVAHGSKEQGMFAGVAIGSVVMLEAMFAGPVCGASMNPARSLSPAVVSGHTEHLWIYLTAPFIGAGIAIGAWRLLKLVPEK